MSGVLVPWMERYAEWMVAMGEVPGQKVRSEMVSRLVGRKVYVAELADLERSTPFLAYVQTVMSDVGREARAVVSAGAREAMEAHIEAIRGLRKEKDYKTLYRYTQPYFDRVFPKHEEANARAPTVNITFQMGTFASRHLVQNAAEAVEVVVTNENGEVV